MSKFKTKRGISFTLIAVLSITAVAVAYFGTTGSGGGSGSVTNANEAVTLSGNGSWTQLGQSKTIDITAASNANSAQRVGAVTVDAITEVAGCPDGSFTAAEPVETNNEVPASGSAVVATVAVTFNNVNSNQNGCIGSDKVAFTYSAATAG